MFRRFILTAAITLLAVSPSAAQQADPGAHVYLAYYKVNFDDLEEYLTLFQQNEVPLLQAMQENGEIVGFGLQQHNTGGEYNLRFAVRGNDWESLGNFWANHLAAYEERNSRDFARANEMIQAHTDEIWDITSSNVQQAGPNRWMYDSKFQVRFGQMDEWNAAWNEVVVPMLDQAIADGLLGGWVIENHNTGGPDNWKVIYLFPEWDTIDDFFEQILPQTMTNPRLLGLMGSAVQSHDDIIWETVPPPGN